MLIRNARNLSTSSCPARCCDILQTLRDRFIENGWALQVGEELNQKWNNMIKQKRKIKKILLVFPPTVLSNLGNVRTCIPPLGIAQLGAVVREQGYSVELLDTLAEGFEYLTPIDKNYDLFGLPIELIAKKIREVNPDLIGVNCLFSNQFPSTADICKCAKEINPKILTVIGGTHPSFLVKECLESCKDIDFIVLGEGEETFLQLIKRINQNEEVKDLEGLVCRSDGEIIINNKVTYINDLDSLPMPAYDLLPMEKYFSVNVSHDLTKGTKRSINYMTSRGCPGQCVFCSSYKHWGNRFRARSATRTLDDLEYLVKKYDIEHVEFTDDNFSVDRKRLKEILLGIKERNLNISWSSPNGIALNTLDNEIISLLKEGGCETLTLPIESGCQEFLKGFIRKKLDLDKAVGLANEMRRVGIKYNAFFIVGFPTETKDQIITTFKFAKMLDPLYAYFFLANPIPGSDLYSYIKEKNCLNPDFSFEKLDYGRSNFRTEYFTSQEREALYYKQYSKYILMGLLRHPFRLTPYIFGNGELAFQALKILKKGLQYTLHLRRKSYPMPA